MGTAQTGEIMLELKVYDSPKCEKECIEQGILLQLKSGFITDDDKDEYTYYSKQFITYNIKIEVTKCES